MSMCLEGKRGVYLGRGVARPAGWRILCRTRFIMRDKVNFYMVSDGLCPGRSQMFVQQIFVECLSDQVCQCHSQPAGIRHGRHTPPPSPWCSRAGV